MVNDVTPFPRTEIAGVSMPRMIIGTNWFTGYSHRSLAQDDYIRGTVKTRKGVADVIEVFLRNGIDAILGLLSDEPIIMDAISEAEDRTGLKCIRIDSPIFNVNDTEQARGEAARKLDVVAKCGADLCMPLHCTVEQLVDKCEGRIRRLDYYTNLIRERGMIPGLSAHMPEVVTYADAQDADVESYIQIYNSMGFLMQVEIETVHRVINNAKKPVIIIKPMAAGRVTPFVGLNFVWSTIRDCDMVAVGTMSPQEAQECIEISRAALERRPPDLSRRATPAKGSILTE